MAATDRHDSKYEDDPEHYAWVGDRWQRRGDSGVDPNAPAAGGTVSGESLGTPGGMGAVLTGLGDRIAGHPFGTQGAVNAIHNITGANEMQARAQAGATAAAHANPYSTLVANQARPAQAALYDQMRAQQAGPSLAAMQGARAQGQNVQAALGSGAGRPVMARAGQVGAGLAADTGSGVLAEQLRASQGIGSMAAGVRSADLGVANAQSNIGLQQRGLDDTMRQFYGNQGSKLTNTQDRFSLEDFKFINRIKSAGAKANEDEINNYISTVSSLAGGGA